MGSETANMRLSYSTTNSNVLFRYIINALRSSPPLVSVQLASYLRGYHKQFENKLIFFARK